MVVQSLLATQNQWVSYLYINDLCAHLTAGQMICTADYHSRLHGAAICLGPTSRRRAVHTHSSRHHGRRTKSKTRPMPCIPTIKLQLNYAALYYFKMLINIVYVFYYWLSLQTIPHYAFWKYIAAVNVQAHIKRGLNENWSCTRFCYAL
jgi:hypothetical protein